MIRHLTCGRHAVYLALVLAISGCTNIPGGTTRQRVHPPTLTPMARYFDASRIQRSGAITAWDAVRFLAPHLRVAEVDPLGVRRSPATAGSGISGTPNARIVVDGFPIADPLVLRAIPASDVIDIQVLGALDAVMRLGQGYGGGAILIRTTAGTRPR